MKTNKPIKTLFLLLYFSFFWSQVDSHAQNNFPEDYGNVPPTNNIIISENKPGIKQVDVQNSEEKSGLTTLISNLDGNDETCSCSQNPERNKAMGFTVPTGSNFALEKVTMRIEHFSQNIQPIVQIWGDAGGLPGSVLITLENPAFNVAGIFNYDFTPGSPFILSGGTTYWLVAYGAVYYPDYNWRANDPGIDPSGVASHAGAFWDFYGPPATSPSSIRNSYSITVSEACEDDNDGDGYISVNCGGMDCDDNDASINPGGTEICDGIDNDCNGEIDDNPVDGDLFYKDFDDDGYTDGTTIFACSTPPPGYKAWQDLSNPFITDCDDNDPYAYPGQTWYQNADGDPYGSGSFTISCTRPPGYSALAELIGTNDCNDNNANTYPGAPEICDSQDNDCNGLIDDGAAVGGTYVGNVVFNNQAQLDDWATCITTIQGNLTVMGGNITNLGPLSNLSVVTGSVTILNNQMLSSLNGLQNLVYVGGNFLMYYNFLLSDCCAIDDLLTYNGIGGFTQIFYNAFGSHCNSEAAIEAACPLVPLVANPGSFTTTGVVVEGKGITIFPNPASNETTVVFSELENGADLMIRDMLGRVVHQQSLEHGTDRVTLNLNNGQFQNGLYLITLMNDGEMVTKQLVIRR